MRARKRLGAAFVVAIAIAASSAFVAGCVDGATADCSDASTYCGPDAAIDSGDAGDAIADASKDANADGVASEAAADASPPSNDGGDDASDGATDAPSIDAATD